MIKKSVIPLLFSISLLFQACSRDENHNEKKEDVKINVIEKKQYSLTTLDNKTILIKKSKNGSGFYIENQKNKIVIFDIFATWCPPCQAEAQHLTALQQKYKDKVIIIGLTIEDGEVSQRIKDFKEQYGADYIFITSKEKKNLITSIIKELKMGERFPIPIMVLYKNGKYITHYVGATQEEFIDSDIKNALKR